MRPWSFAGLEAPKPFEQELVLHAGKQRFVFLTPHRLAPIIGARGTQVKVRALPQPIPAIGRPRGGGLDTARERLIDYPAVPVREDEFLESVRDAPPPRDLGLPIAGTRLESIAQEFFLELARVGIGRLRPRLYLARGWGVSLHHAVIAVPYYLAHAELSRRHARETGHLEDFHRISLLRRLRHSMGHVFAYAYRIYEQSKWIEHFGSMGQPPAEPFLPRPFSRKYVKHLPGWHAQRHPDEDWAETFAVWMTPERDWQLEYGEWPEALAKLAFCDQLVRSLREAPPLLLPSLVDEEEEFSLVELDDHSIKLQPAPEDAELPIGVDGTLRIVFEEYSYRLKSDRSLNEFKKIEGGVSGETGGGVPREWTPASALFTEIHDDCIEHVHKWTGHRKDRIRSLLEHLRERAEAMGLGYRADHERQAAVALTAYITALSMNYMHQGRYLP